MLTVLTIVVVLVVAAACVAGWMFYRRTALRRAFGPEYQNLVQEHGGTREADRELLRRKQEHDKLELKTIGPEERAQYVRAWERLQAGFIDDPAQSLRSAEQLVARILDVRGYPGADPDEQLALLSVRHARSLAGYRDAQRVSRKVQADANGSAGSPGQGATTEQIRLALLSFRSLFNELITAADPIMVDAGGSNLSRTLRSPREGLSLRKARS